MSSFEDPSDFEWEQRETDLELMHRHIRDRFIVDARGRFSSWSARVAISTEALPSFVFARTRYGNTWGFRCDLDAAAVRTLSRYAGREPAVGAQFALPDRLGAMQRALELALHREPVAPRRVVIRLVCRGAGQAAEWLREDWPRQAVPDAVHESGARIIADCFEFD